MARETTYQRLKRENAELKNDIYLLVRKPNEIQGGIATHMKWEMKFKLSEAIWKGTRSLKNTVKFDGLVGLMINKK